MSDCSAFRIIAQNELCGMSGTGRTRSESVCMLLERMVLRSNVNDGSVNLVGRAIVDERIGMI